MIINLNKLYKYTFISFILVPCIIQSCDHEPHNRHKRHKRMPTLLQLSQGYPYYSQYRQLAQGYQRSQLSRTGTTQASRSELYSQLLEEAFSLQQEINLLIAQDQWFAGLPATAEQYQEICNLCSNLEQPQQSYPYEKGQEIFRKIKRWLLFTKSLSTATTCTEQTTKSPDQLQQQQNEVPQQVTAQKKDKIKSTFNNILAILEVIEITNNELAQRILASQLYKNVSNFGLVHKLDGSLEHIKLSPEEYTSGKNLLDEMLTEIERLA